MGELLQNCPSIPDGKSGGWTAKTLRQGADEYFNRCDARTKTVYTSDGAFDEPNPIPYTIEGLCNSLGIVQSTFWKWMQDDNRDSELYEAALLIHQRITENRLVGALDGKQNPSFAKFLLTNNDKQHYRDKIELDAGVDAAVASIFNLVEAAGRELVNTDVQDE